MINEKLNQLLSDYAVEAHKTHNFHWYVKGSADGYKDPAEIFSAILADYESIRNLAAEIKKDADAEDNYLVSAAMDEHIAALSKTIWMIKQSQK